MDAQLEHGFGNDKPKLLVDTESEVHLSDEVEKIKQGLQTERKLVNHIINPFSSWRLKSIPEALSSHLSSEISRIRDGKVTKEMYEPPLESAVEVVGGYSFADSSKTTVNWRDTLQRGKDLQDAAKAGASVLDNGTSYGSLVASALRLGLIHKENHPRIDLLSTNSEDMYAIEADNMHELQNGRVKSYLALGGTTAIPVGIHRNGKKWQWLPREEMGYYPTEYQDIVDDPEEWLARNSQKDNLGRTQSLRYLRQIRQELELANKRLKGILDRPGELSLAIRSAQPSINRLLLPHEYDQLCTGIDIMAKTGRPAHIFHKSHEGGEENSIFEASTDPLKIDQYYTSGKGLGRRRYFVQTSFPVRVVAHDNKTLGMTFGTHGKEGYQLADVGNGFSLLQWVNHWLNNGKTAWSD